MFKINKELHSELDKYLKACDKFLNSRKAITIFTKTTGTPQFWGEKAEKINKTRNQIVEFRLTNRKKNKENDIGYELSKERVKELISLIRTTMSIATHIKDDVYLSKDILEKLMTNMGNQLSKYKMNDVITIKMYPIKEVVSVMDTIIEDGDKIINKF